MSIAQSIATSLFALTAPCSVPPCAGWLVCSVGAALLFELTPHPSSSLPALAKPLIKTQASATVRNIRQLLLQQLRLKVDESELLVYCSDELLAADHSLDFIRRTRWHDPNTHMQIQYKMM